MHLGPSSWEKTEVGPTPLSPGPVAAFPVLCPSRWCTCQQQEDWAAAAGSGPGG